MQALILLGKLEMDPPDGKHWLSETGYLSRVEDRPFTEIWALGLPDQLPVVPVPLLQPDPDVPLDLQAAVDACFDLVGYEHLLEYTVAPPPPQLDQENAAWLEQTLSAAGWR